jgi:hypothetical protein
MHNSRSSATTSRVFTPLPISTASASVTNSIGRCPVTSTPFIDVTTGVGVVMKASRPSLRHLLTSADAMKLSSSLNPSKVTTATCMTTLSLGVTSPVRIGSDRIRVPVP